MKAIMLMFDSLKKDWLPPYGGDIIAPNFDRLAKKTVRFDRFFVGSMPCMPARRELHTGRYGLFHEGWSPLEPYDDSVPEILDKAGVYTHLISDHHHYWRDGGANYHTRYTSYEHMRGQEGDPWKADLAHQAVNTTSLETLPPFFQKMFRQDSLNRTHVKEEKDHSQTLCFDAGIEFLQTNKDADRWFLQLECFDPHEPFFTYENYQRLYPSSYSGRHIDWPIMGSVTQPDDEVQSIQNQYKALVSMIDQNIGRVLDFMDEHDMWRDTMLIVNTDHGLLLGEHDWWSKGAMPLYNEVANIPFFIWDPRSGKRDANRQSLAQNIDVAATLLDFFALPLPPDMQGKPLMPIVEDDTPVHESIIYGYFGGAANITDGRYTYMRGPQNKDNAPLYEYTLMPARMASRMETAQLQNASLAPPFSFTKGCRNLEIDMASHNSPFSNAYRFGSRLYDLESDPGQKTPITDAAQEERLARLLAVKMAECDAPASQYERLGLSKDISAQTLKEQREDFDASFLPEFLTDLNWTREAVIQMQTLQNLAQGQPIHTKFIDYITQAGITDITPGVIKAFAAATLPRAQAGMALMMLQLTQKLD